MIYKRQPASIIKRIMRPALIIKYLIMLSMYLLLRLINNLNSNFRYIFIDDIDQTRITCFLWFVLLLCAISLIKKNWLVIKFLLTIVVSIFLYIRMDWQSTHDQIYIFSSPEHTHTLLVEDFGHTTFYLKESRFVYKRLSVGLASGVPFVAPSWGAFERNEYSIDWLTENIALVSFHLMRETNFEVTIDLSDVKPYKGNYVQIKESEE